MKVPWVSCQGPTTDVVGLWLCLQGAQGGQEGLEFLAAVAAARQMVMHQGHGGGGVLASQRQLDKAVELLETFFAPDLVGAGGQYRADHVFQTGWFYFHRFSSL